MASWIDADTAPDLVIALTSGGAAVDLTTASSVTIRSNDGAGHGLADAAMTVVSPATGGSVSYAWQASDNLVAGVYAWQVTVTWADGTQSTFPDSSPGSYTIGPRVELP